MMKLRHIVIMREKINSKKAKGLKSQHMIKKKFSQQ